MTTLGFTGTREGLTAVQNETLRYEVRRRPPDLFRHGDCIGADETAHGIVRVVTDARIIGHPPTKSVLRAYCEYDHLMSERPYLDRNKDIVNMSDEMIACPDGPEGQRSGTWSTVRYAVRQRKPVTIIYPDGTMEYRGG